MDDALLVRGFERIRNLPRDRHGVTDGNRAARDQIGECFAFNELEDDARQVLGLLEAVDGGDVGMIQCREQLRFTLETSQSLGILREGVGQDLDCDVALQPRAAGQCHEELSVNRALL